MGSCMAHKIGMFGNMGNPYFPEPVRLVIGCLFAEKEVYLQVRSLLEDYFGPLDCEMPPLAFTWTLYYEDELGAQQFRTFLAFENLILREDIVAAKLWTNALEQRFLQNGKRTINLDPGYMTMGQFMLATTKDQRQRVYVREGIFVEPTLYFENGHFHQFPWTYRDYTSDAYLQFLELVRKRFAFQRRTGRPWRLRTSGN